MCDGRGYLLAVVAEKSLVAINGDEKKYFDAATAGTSADFADMVFENNINQLLQ